MATAPDSYRLSVLLEVAGTQVHEDEIQKTKSVLEGEFVQVPIIVHRNLRRSF